MRAGQTTEGLRGHSERFGFDSWREGKLLAGRRLPFGGGVLARCVGQVNNHNDNPSPLMSTFGRQGLIIISESRLCDQAEERGSDLSRVTELKAQGMSCWRHVCERMI